MSASHTRLERLIRAARADMPTEDAAALIREIQRHFGSALSTVHAVGTQHMWRAVVTWSDGTIYRSRMFTKQAPAKAHITRLQAGTAGPYQHHLRRKRLGVTMATANVVACVVTEVTSTPYTHED